MADTDWQADWLDDAPDPDEVNSRVLSLVARRVKPMSERRLRCEDHTDALRLLVAAETYYDLLAHFCMYYTPDAAEEGFKVHKRFALRALAIPIYDFDAEAEAVEALAALAAVCHSSRGRLCTECRFPLLVHVFDPQGEAGCPAAS